MNINQEGKRTAGSRKKKSLTNVNKAPSGHNVSQIHIKTENVEGSIDGEVLTARGSS